MDDKYFLLGLLWENLDEYEKLPIFWATMAGF